MNIYKTVLGVTVICTVIIVSLWLYYCINPLHLFYQATFTFPENSFVRYCSWSAFMFYFNIYFIPNYETRKTREFLLKISKLKPKEVFG
jgi:hypothetical protein